MIFDKFRTRQAVLLWLSIGVQGPKKRRSQQYIAESFPIYTVGLASGSLTFNEPERSQ